MRKFVAGAGVALVAVAMMAGSARADIITLTFEGLQNNEQVLNYYNGGFGGNGSGPGPNYGITFGADTMALIEGADGGTGNFSNPPSGDTVMYFLSGPGDVMNVAAGFTTGFSFYYADQVGFTGSVQVYSGLDGTGTLLANISLPSTPSPYTVFVPIGVSFAGTAESVIFGGSANYIAFDNVTLGSETATGSVPEPSSFVIAGLGGLGFFGYGWRRRRAKAQAA